MWKALAQTPFKILNNIINNIKIIYVLKYDELKQINGPNLYNHF